MKEQAIQQAIKQIDGVNKFMSRKEIKELPNILWENELPEALATGMYGNHKGIVVATDRRAIFIDKGLISLTVEDFPYERISSIEYHTGMLLGSITIYTSGNKAEIKQVPKAEVRPFAEFLRARISAPTPVANVAQPVPAANSDRVTQLERLASLKSQGILTEDEFEQEKRKVLDG